MVSEHVLDVELPGIGAPGQDLGEHRPHPLERLLAGARPVDVEQLVIELGVGEADLEAAADDGVETIEPRAALVGHHLGRPVEEQLGDVGLHPGEEALLGREVEVDRALGDAGRRGDLLHRHALVAVLDDELLGGVEDLAQADVRRLHPG